MDPDACLNKTLANLHIGSPIAIQTPYSTLPTIGEPQTWQGSDGPGLCRLGKHTTLGAVTTPAPTGQTPDGFCSSAPLPLPPPCFLLTDGGLLLDSPHPLPSLPPYTTDPAYSLVTSDDYSDSGLDSPAAPTLWPDSYSSREQTPDLDSDSLSPPPSCGPAVQTLLHWAPPEAKAAAAVTARWEAAAAQLPASPAATEPVHGPSSAPDSPLQRSATLPPRGRQGSPHPILFFAGLHVLDASPAAPLR